MSSLKMGRILLQVSRNQFWTNDRLLPYNGNYPRKKSFTNLANLKAFANVFLHFLSRPEFLYNEITWIAKVFLQTTAKKAIFKTYLPWMIPVIRYLWIKLHTRYPYLCIIISVRIYINEYKHMHKSVLST